MADFARYRDEAEIEEVVRRFENCEYTPDEFVHARHLTVAAWYFLHEEKEAAKERMRQGLKKFIAHHGKMGYHVTITEFWLQQVERVLELGDAASGIAERINRIVARLNDKNRIFEFYSRERIESPEAKAAYLSPDRLPPGAKAR
jgi:nicotinic acid phosphoribosyltransferase